MNRRRDRAPRRAPAAARAGRLVALASGALLAATLGACSGPRPAAPPADAATEPGPVTPTPLGTGLETPLQSHAPGPAITMTAPATGSAEDTAAGHVCLHFFWASGNDVPQLSAGMAFVVDSVHVSPPALEPAGTGCGSDVVTAAARTPAPTPPPVPGCVGARLTVGHLQCDAPMVRVPAFAGKSSAASLLGHLVCSPPVTAQECGRAQAAIARVGAGQAISVPPAPTPEPSTPSPAQKPSDPGSSSAPPPLH